MELFQLTCVTCQARLSVRNPAAIGKILSCPRCGSMVQVTAPDSWVAENSPGFSAQPQTSSSQVPVSSIQPAGSRAQPPVTTPGETPLETLGNSAWYFFPSGLKLPVVAWSLAGTVTAVMLIAVLVGSFGNEPPDGRPADSPAAPRAVASQSQSPGPNEMASALAGSTRAETNRASIPIEFPTSEPALPANLLPGGQPAAGPTAEPDVDLSAPAAAVASESETAPLPTLPVGPGPRAGKSASKQAVAKPAVQSGLNQPSHVDPLELDPEGFDMASFGRQQSFPGLAASFAGTGPTGAVEPKVKVPAGPPSTPGKSLRGQVSSASSTNLESLNTQVVRMDPGPVPKTEMPSAEKHLALRLPAIDVDQMPLYAFLELVSGLSQVPIQLGSEELRMAALSAAVPVSVHRQQTSLAEILRAALRPLHLDYRPLGPMVVIYWPGAEKDREIGYPIADLVTPESDAQRLAEWIRQLVVPSSWRAAGGEGELQVVGDTLHIVQSQRVQYQVLCFLERLRRIRKLKPRSRYPAERLPVEPALQQLADTLNGPAVFTFSRYTPLSEIFSYWQQQLGLALLVDWSAVMGESSQPHQGSPVLVWKPRTGRPPIGPATRVACSVVGQPWHRALDTVLGPLGLAWRAIDGHTLQITSALVAQGTAQLEFYPLFPEGPPGQQRRVGDRAIVAARMAELQKLAEASKPTPLSHSQTALILDPVSQHLLALQPASVQWNLWQRIYAVAN